MSTAAPTRPCGVFAGLAILDVIHRIPAPPGTNPADVVLLDGHHPALARPELS